MHIVREIPSLRSLRDVYRANAETVALVPTMGNLHAGHLSLIRQAQGLANRVVVSIFVNPLQFDRPEDLAAYPRTLEQDCALLADQGVDLVFAPSEAGIYPRGRESIARIHVPGLSTMLEGAHRPGHFDGVATVVCKLFNLVQPDLAVFGQKDFQQLLLIRKMVDDLDIPVRIVSGATLRHEDGLAMSSRNAYLSDSERVLAPALCRVLQQTVDRLVRGEPDFAMLEQDALKELEIQGLRPDYVAVRRSSDMSIPDPQDKQLVVLAAAWLGRARLIDNMLLDVS